MKKLVPGDFKVPEILETDKFRLRMLTVNDVVKDYDAVMTSIDHLQGLFGPYSKWPTKDLTLERDLIDLGWHQKEFINKTSFAFTVMNLDETKCLGCLYLFPSNKKGYEVDIFMWVRASHYVGLDEILFNTVRKWIKERWPFKRVLYPGRETSWEKYNNFKDK